MTRKTCPDYLRRLLFTSVGLMLALAAIAQQPDPVRKRIREVGLYGRNLNGFGLTYRFGNEKAVWRLQAFNAKSDLQLFPKGNFNVRAFSIAGGISFGREYRSPIRENLEFRFGPEIGLSLSMDDRENFYGTFDSKMLLPQAGVIIGLNYKIKERLILGADLVPTLGYKISSIDNQNYDPNLPRLETSRGFEFSTQNLVQFSFCVRF